MPLVQGAELPVLAPSTAALNVKECCSLSHSQLDDMTLESALCVLPLQDAATLDKLMPFFEMHSNSNGNGNGNRINGAGNGSDIQVSSPLVHVALFENRLF